MLYSENLGIPHDVTNRANTTARWLRSMCWRLWVGPCACVGSTVAPLKSAQLEML